MGEYRLAVLTSHPIQYQAPLFRKLAAHPSIDLVVYFCSDFGVTRQVDPGFGLSFKWDIPLLDGYRHIFLKNRSRHPSVNSFWGMVNPGIISELRSETVDAILVHGYASASAWLAFLAAKLNRMPIILRGESTLLYKRAWWIRATKRVLFVPLFSQIDAFSTIGQCNTEFYRAYGVSEQRMFLAPYAVDNDYFQTKRAQAQQAAQELRAKLGFSPETPLVLFVGKLIERKRLMDLLRAFDRAIAPGLPAGLILVGDGVERERLNAYVQERNLGNRVVFAGFRNQSELPTYYALGDVFVLPSREETWGLVVNEAMNFGRPIVATNCLGVTGDLVIEGQNGFTFPLGDIEMLAAILRNLLGSVELRCEFGRRSLEIISDWNFDRDVAGILETLEFVATQSRRE